jgi:hypothetical protein
MLAQPDTNPHSENDRLDAAADDAIAACGGDLRSTIRALILANEFLEYELQMATSNLLRGAVQPDATDSSSDHPNG